MKLSFRISVHQYAEEEQFETLLRFLSAYRGCVDEVALFTEPWHHGYFPLDAFADRAAVLKDRMNRLRANGFRSVGINMLCTLGHLADGWDWLPALPHQPAMGPDGTLSRSSFCPNTAGYRSYIARKYALAAEAGPDFIWVDDDIRLFSLDVDFACFCPECIRIFNTAHATDWIRERLVAELNSVGGSAARKEWVAQNSRTLERLMKLIADTVHGIDARIELGLMTIGIALSTYSGPDLPAWMMALQAVRGRPGHGFYDDEKPLGFVNKVHEVNRQIAYYPAEVKDIQYELENFPYAKLKKSIHIMLLECTASLASGTHGVAFNVLRGEAGPLDDYHERMQGILASKPLWTAMDAIAGDDPNVGLYPALSPLFEARRSVTNGNWFEMPSGDSSSCSYVLSELGIPLTMNETTACATVLSGNMPEGYTADELKAMLGRGVLLDGRALEILIKKGLGGFCGVSIDKTCNNGVFEILTDDALNGRYRSGCRDARELTAMTCYILKPLAGSVRVLSRLVSFTGDDLGPASTLYENTLGGRVAVLGYIPWLNIHSSLKRSQILEICDWLSFGRLPVRIDRCVKVVPFIRMPADGRRWFVMLVNAAFDATGAFKAKIRGPADDCPIFELLADGSSTAVPEGVIEREAGGLSIQVGSIGSWQFRIFYKAQRRC